jgi:hypothetical protein
MIISSALVFVWYLQAKQTKPPQELSFDAALTQIKNKDIKEVTVKQDTLELTNKSDVKFTARLDASDSTRDQIYLAANQTDTVIKLEPPSSGLGWLVLVNALPVVGRRCSAWCRSAFADGSRSAMVGGRERLHGQPCEVSRR